LKLNSHQKLQLKQDVALYSAPAGYGIIKVNTKNKEDKVTRPPSPPHLVNFTPLSSASQE